MDKTEFDVVQGDGARFPSRSTDDWFVLRDTETDEPLDLTGRQVDFILTTSYSGGDRVNIGNVVTIHDDPTTGQVAIELESTDTAISFDSYPQTLYGKFRVREGAHDPTTLPVNDSISITLFSSPYTVETDKEFMDIIPGNVFGEQSEPDAPGSGWYVYTDAMDGNLKGKGADGSVVTIISDNN